MNYLIHFKDNFTRFYVVSKDNNLPLELPIQLAYLCRALVVFPSVQTNAGRGMGGNIIWLLDSLTLPVVRIDRRPSAQGHPFQSVYFAELGRSELCSALTWREELGQALERIGNGGGDASLLGDW